GAITHPYWLSVALVRLAEFPDLVDVLALPGPGYSDSTMVVAVSDQQFDGAVDKSVLDRIVTSYRQLS
ncbi:hypothetical protein ACFQ1S_43945, partial [Kibdelosporangium lantanae]